MHLLENYPPTLLFVPFSVLHPPHDLLIPSFANRKARRTLSICLIGWSRNRKRYYRRRKSGRSEKPRERRRKRNSKRRKRRKTNTVGWLPVFSANGEVTWHATVTLRWTVEDWWRVWVCSGIFCLTLCTLYMDVWQLFCIVHFNRWFCRC